MSLISYQRLRGDRVYDIDLAAPAQERWRAFGREFGGELQDLVDDAIASCEEQFAGVPSILRPLVQAAAHGASRLGGTLVGLVARWFGAEYADELKGLAKAAEVSYPKLVLANLSYDISQASERFGAARACSSFSCQICGRPILARTMDWDLPPSLGRHTIVFRFHRRRESYLSIGVVGLVGALSAMMPGRWSVSLNQAPSTYLPVNCLQWPPVQRLRAAADGMGTFHGLVRRLCEFQTMTPCFFHAIGTKPSEHVVINGMGWEFTRRRMTDRILIQTNHFIDEEHLNPPDEETDAEGVVWTYDSRPRYAALERRLRALPTSLADAMRKLSRLPVTNESTQQAMVLSPVTGEFRLKVRVED